MANLQEQEQSPVTLHGSDVAFKICSQFVPAEKIELKFSCKKTEITSTADYSGGRMWENFAPGNSGGTLTWDGHWRISSAVIPPDIKPGAIYPIEAYVRRPGVLSDNDPGAFWSGYLFIDDQTVILDPKTGVITWKGAGTFCGPTYYRG